MPSSPTDKLLKPEVLRRSSLLAGLSDAEIKALAGLMRVQRFGRGEYVLQRGSAPDALMFLLAGTLQVVNYTAAGIEIGLNLLTPGSFFGELSLIDGQPRSASIIAVETAAVAYLPREHALRLIYSHPVVAECMLRHFAAAIRNLTQYRELLAIPRAHQRVCALLSRLSRLGGNPKQENGKIQRLPTQQQMAIMINTSRETVSRTIAELEQLGVLRRQGNSLSIIDPESLDALAQGHPFPPPRRAAK